MKGYVYYMDDYIFLWYSDRSVGISFDYDIMKVKDLEKKTYMMGQHILVTEHDQINRTIDSLKAWSAEGGEDNVKIRVVEIDNVENDDGMLYVRPIQAFEAYRRGRTVKREGKEIIIKESVRLPDTNIILENGDKIRIIKGR